MSKTKPRAPFCWLKKLGLGAALLAMTQAPLLAQADPPGTGVSVSASARASTSSRGLNLLLVGGPGPMAIDISLSADGRTYTIKANGPLEVGTQACENPPNDQDELVCQASAISSFEINGGNAGSTETVSKNVPVPATLRGGVGNDVLIGGSDDTLFGRAGEDILIGRGSDDRLYGGHGNDRLQADGSGDVLNGGPGYDTCIGNPVRDTFISCEVIR